MKRYFLLLLLLQLLFGCDHSRESFVVGVSQCSEDLWRETANREMIREASFDRDLTLEIRSVHSNSEEQIRDVEYFINKKVDLLVVSPNEATSLTPVVSKAFRSGIPVILFDRKIDSDDYSTYIGADNVQIGEQIGNYLVALALRENKKAFQIIVIRGTSGSTADTERYEGLLESIRAASNVDIRIFMEQFADFTRENAYNAMSRIIGSGIMDDTVDAIIAFNDEMAIGVHEALDQLLPGKELPPIVGIDALSGEDGGIRAIQNGIISASFIYPTGGDVVIDVASKILHHTAFDRNYILNTALVNPENVRVLNLQREEIESRQSKLEEISEKLGDATAMYGYQRRTNAVLAFLIGMILLFCFILLSLNRRRKHMNEVLNERNAQIQEHIQKLEAQNNQLVDLTKQLEDATQAKLVFYTNVSHEFRTPLTLILGSTDMLLESSTLQNEDKRSLNMIKRNGSKLLFLIHELLDFRTYDNNKMTVDYSRVDLKLFLEEINNLFTDIVRKKTIQFSFRSDYDSFDLQTDKNKLEKIYFNILSNAFKFVKEGGTVTVGLEKIADKRQIRLSVFNSHSYIPEDKIQDIFKMFYTGNPFDLNSSGIGLALTKSLVDLMKGEIKVESSESSGTTFTVLFPFLLPDESPQNPDYGFSYATKTIVSDEFSSNPEIPIEAPGPDDSEGTILAIEDNQDMLELIKSILSSDYRVLIASNGKEGVDKAILYRPDLIISDIMMPVMDGYEVCRQVKGNEKTKLIPIILLTAFALDEQRKLGYEAGADAFLQKPFNADVLKTRIHNLVRNKNTILESTGYSWLVGKGNRIPSQESEILDRVTKYITDHLDENISIDDLASAVGTSRSNLYKKIKEVTDYSPVDLINLLKIKRALALVLYQHNNITEAAYESGFSSSSYFSRTFVKYYKTSPRSWIKEHYGNNTK
jgi:signal transduction histidine kinase/DNA-binding response OmpR family regulator